MDDLIEQSGGQLWQRDCAQTGVTLRGISWCPEESKPSACALILHGLQSNSLWNAGLGKALCARGVPTFAADRRGSGLSDGYLDVGGAQTSPADGVSGARGHHRRKRDFIDDVETALAEIDQQFPGTPIHLIANCFSTRIALAFLKKNPERFASLTFVTPGSDMLSRCDLPPRSKLLVIWPFGCCPRWADSPLQDPWFVSSGQKLDWISDDTRSLSLRTMSSDFIRSTAFITCAGKSALSNTNTRLLAVLAGRDAMVDNEATEQTLTRWQGEVQVEHLPTEHAVDFDAEHAAQFRTLVGDWILREG